MNSKPTKQEFIFRSNAIFEAGLSGLVRKLRGNPGTPLLSYIGGRTATRYMEKPTKANRNLLVRRLSADEYLDNFQVVQVLQFIDWYRKNRKRYDTRS